MTLTDLNPGDIIRPTPAEWRVNIFGAGRDISKETFEISYLKLNDSFPEVIIQVPMIKKQLDVHGTEFVTEERYIPYGLNAQEIELVEHLARNNKRWNWIVDRKGIGDNYPTLYYSCIAGNEYAKFNWQTWGKDGYYHCPFCDKQLNKVAEIENTKPEKGAQVTFIACDCEGWKKRYDKWVKYTKTKAKLEKLEKEVLGPTEIPWKENHNV